MFFGKKVFFIILLSVFVLTAGLAAQDADLVNLPAPQMTGGKPLLDCLKARQSGREFSSEKLPLRVLSNLLWAADGINRPDSGKRTAPSAVNWQDIDVYAATADGVFLYLSKEHALKKIVGEDLRAAMGKQEFVKDVPLNLVYVSDYSKIPRGTDEDKRSISGTHTGFISQNVYLFCASEGLSTVVRGLIDEETAAKAMKLRPEQHITLAQSVGYPKK
ncbi:MAG TPA: nitroreductase [Candidatus Aminicenantes bacterium]|nr:nitroreductase [Candidatus Aminicenantes bacterium]